MRRADERGGALPAALGMLLILVLAGTQMALAAALARLGGQRLAALRQARQDAEAALHLASLLAVADLARSLESGTPLFLPGDLPLVASVELQALDDDDGDHDPHRDSNGRLLLRATGRRAWRAGAAMVVESVLVQERLVGAWWPAVGGILDCSAGVRLCSTQPCRPEASRLDGGGAPALVAPEAGLEALARLWRDHVAGTLRAAGEACSAPAGCAGDDSTLVRAAATAIIRALEDATGDALGLNLAQAAALVQGFLDLRDQGDQGVLAWWDGSSRSVAAAALLEAVMEEIGKGRGLQPALESHPLTLLLGGGQPSATEGGTCQVLQPLLAQARRQAPEPSAALITLDTGGPLLQPPGIYRLTRDLVLQPGQSLAGRGLLLLAAGLEVAPQAVLRWQGVVVVEAGGSVSGGGTAQVAGTVLVAGGELDLASTRWQVAATAVDLRQGLGLAGHAGLLLWEKGE